MAKDILFSRRQALQSIGLAGASLAMPGLAPWAAAAAQPLPPIAAKDLIIAFGHAGAISGGGWELTHHQGRLAIEEAYPEVKCLEVETIPFSAKGTRIIRQFVGQGAKMVFLTSSYDSLAADVIKSSPDVAFLEGGSASYSDNKVAYYAQHWNPTYIIGVAAGLLTKTNKLGFVGGFPTQGANMSMNALHLGARSVNPNIETQAIYINSWSDPQAARQASAALLQNGCDYLMGMLANAVYLQVAEEEGAWASTWNTDNRHLGPNAYVSSILVDWKEFYKQEVKARIEGTWSGNRLELLKLGIGTDRDKWGAKVPEAVGKQADAVREKILQGTNVFTGEIKDGKGNVQVPKGHAMTIEECYFCDWVAEGITAKA